MGDAFSIRKSAFGRTDLFLSSSSVKFNDYKCSSSMNARQVGRSMYHMHTGNNSHTRPPACLCWHCCHDYEGEGYRVPRIFDTMQNLYHVYGWFCSPNCAKTYIIENSSFDRGYQMNIFIRMLRDVYDINHMIQESPPRLSLQIFGGPFDIERFRSNHNTCRLVQPPFVSYSMLIEEHANESKGNETNNVFNGSVRGLRRPSVSQAQSDTRHLDGKAKPESLYNMYLKDRSSMSVDDSTTNTQPKRPRAEAKSTKTAGGLSKFAATNANKIQKKLELTKKTGAKSVDDATI